MVNAKILFLISIIVVSLQQYITLNTFYPWFDGKRIISLKINKIDRTKFVTYKNKMKKKYISPEQQLYRQMIYTSNQAKINRHNSYSYRSYNQQVNVFADLDQQQFLQKYAKLKSPTQPKKIIQVSNKTYIKREFSSDGKTIIQYNTINIKKQINIYVNSDQAPQNQVNNNIVPDSKQYEVNAVNTIPSNFNVDWSQFTGPVNDQGACGSCYIFSVIDHISALYYKYSGYKNFTKLSAQQILDCGYTQISQGCLGGMMQGTFHYIITQGISSQISYPYISAKSGKQNKCSNKTGPFRIAYFQKIKSGDCLALHQNLMRKPIPIGIAGTRLQFYKEGTFDQCSTRLDHAVLLIGFDNTRGWKIKNSWGTSWGQNGYGWIQDGNNCGICNMAITASIQQQLNYTE